MSSSASEIPCFGALASWVRAYFSISTSSVRRVATFWVKYDTGFISSWAMPAET